MLYFDLTKTAKSRHQSGLTRVSRRLLDALQAEGQGIVKGVYWDDRKALFRSVDQRVVISPQKQDWILTPELFDEEVRPGFGEFLQSCPARTAAIFHDAIPLRHPEITWPQSVARHPFYMKLLAGFDRVMTVSETVGVDLAEYWDWLRLKNKASLHAINLGADFTGEPRVMPTSLKPWKERDQILVLGILEPRKNQQVLLEALSFLWKQSFPGRLALVGRVNPHFGKETLALVKKLKKAGFPLEYHGQVDDQKLITLYQESRCLIFPSLAEGCGLPVLEAMWQGLPVLANRIPSVVETSVSGGCHLMDCHQVDELSETLLQYWDDATFWERLESEVAGRSLPTWRDTARQVMGILEVEPLSV